MERKVSVPEKVSVQLEGSRVSVKGPKGELSKSFDSPIFNGMVKIEKNGQEITVTTAGTRRKLKSEVGTVAASITNMIRGVTEGWRYRLKVVYMHFPVTVKIQGREVLISNFLGEKAPRKASIIGSTKVELAGDEMTVSGTDLEATGQRAGNIERATRILARDRRVFMDGIFITEKPE